MKFNFESFLKEEKQKDYFISIFDYLEKHPTYFPSKENIFNAFKNFDYDNLKIIIIGQDPYATKGYADGLCFSTKSLVRPKWDCTKFCVKFEILSLIDKIFIKKGFLFYEKETSKSNYR